MATTSIGATGVTFPDSTVQASSGATGVNTITVGTTSGTWTKPATVKSIKVTVVGGGGPSGAYPNQGAPLTGGGGGGGTAIRFYPAASIPGPQPYTVGGAGATSSFGAAPITVVSATGGGAGSTSSAGGGTTVDGGSGGAGSNGNINLSGANGERLYLNTPSTFIAGGNGGSSFLGAGGTSGTGLSRGQVGQNYGGGAGGSGPVAPGPATAGAQGVVIIEEFY